MIIRATQQLLWVVSDRTAIAGIPVAIDDSSRREAAVGALGPAFALLDTTWPRWLGRMRQYVTRIQVTSSVIGVGGWCPIGKQVELSTDFLVNNIASPAYVASIIVHEYTHARIDASGIPYSPALRTRIEQVCVSEQLAFLRALTPTSEISRLIAAYEHQRSQAAHVWSTTSIYGYMQRTGERVGLPPVLVRLLLGLRKLLRRDAA